MFWSCWSLFVPVVEINRDIMIPARLSHRIRFWLQFFDAGYCQWVIKKHIWSEHALEIVETLADETKHKIFIAVVVC